MRFVALLALAGLVGLAGCTESTESTDGCQSISSFENSNPQVTLETNLGCITAEIFVDQVPVTGMNFVRLSENGTFDGVPFHRIITNFMMQGGDYTNRNGSGGRANPDYADANGHIPDEYSPDLRHNAKGIFSMANAGAGTGSSQFFITFGPTPHLDAYDANGKLKNCAQRGVSCHAVFGKVIDGMDVLDQVNQQAGSQSGAPQIPVTLIKATVTWP